MTHLQLVHLAACISQLPFQQALLAACSVQVILQPVLLALRSTQLQVHLRDLLHQLFLPALAALTHCC